MSPGFFRSPVRERSSEVVPEHTTWYGMREIAVREPGGHTVVFAATVPT